MACFSSQNRNAAHQCLLATCIVSHNGSMCLLWCASQYLRIPIEDWRQECSLQSLKSTRPMSLVSTLETLCIHCSKLFFGRDCIRDGNRGAAANGARVRFMLASSNSPTFLVYYVFFGDDRSRRICYARTKPMDLCACEAEANDHGVLYILKPL